MLNIGTSANANASISVDARPDGSGFDFHGTFNLTGAIVPNGPGKWKLSGQFSVAETDFAVGTPEIVNMGMIDLTGSGAPADTAMINVVLPVRPPAAKAPDGAAMRVVPVQADIDAPEKVRFGVTFTQM